MNTEVKVYTVKGFNKLNKEFDKLDNDPKVIDYEFDTIYRGDDAKQFEYEFQVITNKN